MGTKIHRDCTQFSNSLSMVVFSCNNGTSAKNSVSNKLLRKKKKDRHLETMICLTRFVMFVQEYIKQREAATTDDTERQEAEPALHVEVRSMLQSLFNKLDALSNYHYTPRPVSTE